MAKYQAKTTENEQSVSAYVKQLEKSRQADCQGLIDLFSKASGLAPKMWGTAIIGFGSYHYIYESGHEGDAPLVGFSPRKNEFALYIANFEGKEELLKKLGKHKTAKSCVYIRSLEGTDQVILKKLVMGSVKYMKNKYR